MNIVKKFVSFILTASAILGVIGYGSAGNLVIYSSEDETLTNELIPVFRAQNPDINVQAIRDSGGTIVARVLAERDNPRADVIWAVPANALVFLDKQKMFEPYMPADFDQLKPKYKDETNPVPTWFGSSSWTNAICFNTAEAGNIEPPKSWKELSDPKYRGKIVMPDPHSSGTALTMLANWLQVMGEEEGWKFIAALDENVTQYVHSGSAPCRMAARGETLIGLSYPNPGVEEINRGAPVQVIFLPEGNGAEVAGNAILRGAKNLNEGKRFIDFLMGEEAQKMTAIYNHVVARKGVHVHVPNYPENEEELQRIIDFAWLADNKQNVLERWKALFGSKSAPRN